MGLISSWIILLFVAIVLLFVSVAAQNTEQLDDSLDVNPLDTIGAIEASVKRQIGYSFGKYIFLTLLLVKYGAGESLLNLML